MMPLNTVFCNKILSSIQNSYPTVLTDGTSTFLVEENDKATSYLALNNSTYNYLGVAVRYNNPKLTLRQGLAGKDTEARTQFIEHRNATMQKLYPQVFNDADLVVGDVLRWSGTFFIAKFAGLSDLF